MKKLSWRELNDQMQKFDEQQVLGMLNEERATTKRANYLERLHRRYCALRTARERQEILKEAERA
jgi:hypothetical protein